jgi:NAD(P)-dependent dehydrogenase (short-subunit alcohol dehydrogenase family)
VDLTSQGFGRVDIAVNNIALSRWAHATTIEEDFVTTLGVMSWGMRYLTLAVLSEMWADAVGAW